LVGSNDETPNFAMSMLQEIIPSFFMILRYFFLKRLQFLQFLSYFIDLLIIAVSCLIYRVTCVIMNDFERENFYVVNFINRETLHRSIGMINKIT